ncbi:sodium/potassium/calcium exchanger 4-like isoform X1 [Xyrauchen texanus]|uniref:sodium/potassium/calcium exchanger 4-like isoform X1 n=1 Tax=Xyrauchen texanus TaxID=154827 RepID=UPI00224226BC|nr:sodium/potassium/calcium exchanger 4-like isoform X1 [Xyrauchen texanus]
MTQPSAQSTMELEQSCSRISKKSMITKIFKVRKRREMLFVQVCFICSVLSVTWCMSALLTKTGHGLVLQEGFDAPKDHLGRRLLATVGDNETEEKNCTEPAIHEFPEDVFSNRQRKQGAVLLHIFAALYMFLALAIVCDDYFVTSLEKICEKLHMSEDVAGATFMAAGSSAPELFASIIGVFITHGDVGVGTIVGSAVFNILCIIGVCGIFAGQVVYLTKFSVFRDSIYYIFSVVALIAFIYDGKIVWWESLVLIIMYVGYIIIMKFNSSMQNYFAGKEDKSVANGNTVISEMEDGNAYYQQFWDDPSWPLLSRVKPSKTCTRVSVVRVDEMINSSPPHYRFPEAGLRVMITNHFGPKTRLRMASRLIINEQQRLMKTANGVDAVLVADKTTDTMENGNVMEDKLTEEPENEISSPFSLPGGCMDRVKLFISWPILVLLYFTVPNCAKPRWEHLFMLSFFLSTLWIAIFSYFMVWMVTIVGYTLGIPDVIMGITFLAAGTSVPDCIASLIVARQGLGDMAVSNTIGSNVFDILVGLGVPWGIQTMAVNYGSVIQINSRGLVYSVVLLLGSVALTVLGIHVNRWKLDFKLGMYVLVLYAVFLCFSVMIEYNVFTFVNLPMCQEDL